MQRLKLLFVYRIIVVHNVIAVNVVFESTTNLSKIHLSHFTEQNQLLFQVLQMTNTLKSKLKSHLMQSLK